ncbi:EF-hand domain-containing protein [uncultured Phyllobacterium sp.]|uniref:EF-hand domain-containing protein n=1 Tax=uncultured Phyllobacterium sp. TaxID=253813 RepID=UPI00258D80A2|nr:EF-hand domain-containing protein [uncultured Phyllobacterium sp.]
MSISRTIFISFLLTSMAGQSAQAGDRVWHPEPGIKSVKQDATSIQRQLDQELRAKFDAAAKSNHLLTAQAASAAGWGFIAEHFAQIDKDQDGYLTFDDVQTFFDARSPMPAARTRAAKAVQVVE